MRQLNLSQSKLLSELVIPIQITLGEISISAAELIDLRGGEHFPIHIEKESPVTLVVAGEAIAKGKIVKENSVISVLITEIHSDSWETNAPIRSIGNERDKMENLI